MSDAHAFERQITDDTFRMIVDLESGKLMIGVDQVKLSMAIGHVRRAQELAHEAWGLLPPVAMKR